METKQVYAAISQVQRALSVDGITKSRKNATQGYQFRGIDDVYNALSIPLAEAKLCIIPRFVERNVVERESAANKALFYVTVKGEFDLVGPDGSLHTAVAFGEAMDSADKATNKAMSAAYKYMCMQVFCIPTEGDNDADAKTHEVKAAKPIPKTTAEWEREDPALVDYLNRAEQSPESAKDVYAELNNLIAKASNKDAAREAWLIASLPVDGQPPLTRDKVRQLYKTWQGLREPVTA